MIKQRLSSFILSLPPKPTVLYLILLLISLVLYAPTLTFPAFYDTLLNTQLADDLNLWTVWLPNEAFGFYRPLVFLPAVLMNTILGNYSPFLGHLYNLLNHLLNLFLLTHLAHRLWQRWPRTAAVGLLFATFPFSYQSLAIHGNAAYLTVTAVILLALHSLLTHGRPKPAHFIPLFLVGVLTNESAILLIPIVALFVWMRAPEDRWRTAEFWRPYGWLVGMLAVYLVIYLFLPRGGGPQLDYGGNDLWQKILIFCQLFAYPFAWFGPMLNTPARPLLMGGAVLTLCGIGTSIWLDRDQLRPLFFAFGWWLSSAMLIGITLPTYYIADGARLFYLGGAGLALGWGILLDGVWGRNSVVWRQAMAALLVLFVAITSGRSGYTLIQTYRTVSTPFHTITETMAQQPAEQGVVIVNLPQWQAPARPAYPVTSQFAPFMGDHLFAAELFRVNAGGEREIYTLVVPELRREMDTPYDLYQAFATETLSDMEAQHSHVFTYRYDDNEIRADYRGIISRGYYRVRATPFLARTEVYTILSGFGDACGQELEVTLDITILDGGNFNIRPTATFFVQAFTVDGRLIAQADGLPFDLPYGRVDLDGLRLHDIRQLTLPEGETAAYLLVGTYDFVTGVRHEMIDSAGFAITNDALFIPVQNCPILVR